MVTIMNATNWYNEFKCPGGDCGLTCCTGEWKISITDDEIEMYKNMESEYKKTILENIDEKEKTIKCTGRRCNLMNSDGFCTIVLNCGEQFISKTCTDFPRKYAVYGQDVEAFVEIVCPLVAQRLFDKEPIRTSKLSVEISAQGEINEDEYKALLLSRSSLLKLFEYNFGDYLYGKLFILYKVFEQIRELYDINKLNEQTASDILSKYFGEAIRDSILNKCQEVNKMREAKLFAIRQYLYNMAKDEYMRHMLEMALSEIPYAREYILSWISEEDILSEDLNEYLEGFKEYCPTYNEQFFIYTLYRDWINMDNNKFSMILSLRIIELFLIQIFNMAIWKANNKRIDPKQISVVVAVIDRLVTHSQTMANKIYEFFMKNLNGDAFNLLLILLA